MTRTCPELPGRSPACSHRLPSRGCGRSRRSWLGDHLVNNAVQFLPGVEIVVSLEHRRDMVTHEQLVNRQIPSGAVFLETIGAVGFLPPHSLNAAISTPPRAAWSPLRRLWMKMNLNLARLCSSVCSSHGYCACPRDHPQPSPLPRCRIENQKGSSTTKSASPIPRHSSFEAGRSAASACCSRCRNRRERDWESNVCGSGSTKPPGNRPNHRHICRFRHHECPARERPEPNTRLARDDGVAPDIVRRPHRGWRACRS